jgi:hypothetical protein
MDYMNNARTDDVTVYDTITAKLGWDSATSTDALVNKALTTNAAPQTRSPSTHPSALLWNKSIVQSNIL